MYFFFIILAIYFFMKVFSKKFRQMKFNNINIIDNKNIDIIDIVDNKNIDLKKKYY
jgi:hypothetical protein